MVPYVRNLRTANFLPEDSTAWYQLDGENMQIKCYKDEEMLK